LQILKQKSSLELGRSSVDIYIERKIILPYSLITSLNNSQLNNEKKTN